MPARELAERATAKLNPEAASLFRRLTDAYLAERFGGHQKPESFWEDGLRNLKLSLKTRQ
jgi:hypothetical protein